MCLHLRRLGQLVRRLACRPLPTVRSKRLMQQCAAAEVLAHWGCTACPLWQTLLTTQHVSPQCHILRHAVIPYNVVTLTSSDQHTQVQYFRNAELSQTLPQHSASGRMSAPTFVGAASSSGACGLANDVELLPLTCSAFSAVGETRR